jgi:hypothetical protein
LVRLTHTRTAAVLRLADLVLAATQRHSAFNPERRERRSVGEGCGAIAAVQLRAFCALRPVVGQCVCLARSDFAVPVTSVLMFCFLAFIHRCISIQDVLRVACVAHSLKALAEL